MRTRPSEAASPLRRSLARSAEGLAPPTATNHSRLRRSVRKIQIQLPQIALVFDLNDHPQSHLFRNV